MGEMFQAHSFIGFVFFKIFVVCLVFSIGFDEATLIFQFLFELDTCPTTPSKTSI
jgi:hypothetical protein